MNGAGDGNTTPNPNPPPPPTSPSEQHEVSTPPPPTTPHIGDLSFLTPATDNTSRQSIVLADNATTHLASVPQSAISDFSIDSPMESPGVATVDESRGNNANANANNSNHNGGEGNGDTSDDDTDITEEDSAEAFGLAQRTNQIMSSYKDYISEIQSDATIPELEGGNAAAAAALADLESGGMLNGNHNHGASSNGNGSNNGGVGLETGGVIAPHSPFRYDSNDTQKLNNLRDVGLPTTTNGDSGDGGKMDDASSFEDFYGELSFHPRRNYRHALLHNKNFQRFAMGAVGFLVLLGVIAGVSTRGSGERAESAMSFTTSPGNDDGDELFHRPPDFNPANPNNGTVIHEYKPKWYSRTTGYRGTTYAAAMSFCAAQSLRLCPYAQMCPDGPSSLPFGGIQTDPSGYATIAAEGGGAQWSPILSEDESSQVWVKVGNGMPDTCDEYLDLDRDGFVGKGTEEGGMTTEEITRFVLCCEPEPRYFHVDGESVMHANGGELSEGQLDQSAQSQPKEELTKEQLDNGIVRETTLKYRPRSFDRERGWTGRTCLEAVHFCTTAIESDDGEDGNDDGASDGGAGDRYKLCSYEAICPLGSDSEPIGGSKGPSSNINGDDAGDGSTDVNDDDGRTKGMWTPISNQGNDWVQIGMGSSSCIRYTNEYANPPVWGLTGEGNEGVTQHVICCLDLQEEDDNVDIVASDGKGGSLEIYEPADNSNGNVEYDPAYPDITAKYKPQWFDRSTGWNGKTYLQALAFCASVESMIICPSAAICPDGDGGNVYGGYKMASYTNKADTRGGEAWTPIMDSVNNWLQV
eukprot:CAMPEP_0172314916 /NCGR_PEP_ID=MMETSP1058-20130122/23519_1 /TAXON_ID=83371 /ORGANISM="Detonula confervacea, Strain CCMP 353" /LENGTH=807 /DNA_ID=CAMNT_0013028871 /DNA_START=128 /DNA_END=2548 /DNA_ORIENTATION=-